jgi:type IV secretory pathway VirB2 component (pilin)
MLPLMLAKITISCGEISACPAGSKNLGQALTNITALVMGLVGGLAVIFIIVSGLQMILSNGDAKRYQNAKLSLFYSVLGLSVAIGAYAIVSFIVTRIQ